MIKKLTFGMLASGLSAGCFSSLESSITKTMAEPQHLYVNTSLDHYVIQKSRAEGEKDQYELTETSKLEEMFVFRNLFSGREEWHEAGIAESEYAVKIHFPLKKWIVNEDETKELTFYHFHTIEREGIVESSQVPSRKDLIWFHGMIRNMHKLNLSMAKKVDFRIVVSTGTYTFKFDTVRMNNQKDFKTFLTVCSAMEDELSFICAGASENFNYRHENKTEFANQNKKFAGMFSSDVMNISFEPRSKE